MENIETVKEILMESPSSITRSEIIETIALYFLPENTGIEIECDKKEDYDIKEFEKIGLVAVNVDFSEQRYQIPSGLDGFLVLEKLTYLLVKYSLLNYGSGIHYHVNASSFIDKVTCDVRKLNSSWILEELDAWGYKGTFNTREFSNVKCRWVASRDYFKTIEFRIGEMTFDYRLLIKRILHCQSIVKRLKYICLDPNITIQVEINKLKELLKEIPVNQELDLNQVNQVVSSRKVKITY